MDNETIPLCLYYNHNTTSNYIGNSTQEKVDDQILLNCESKPNLKFIAQFYAINPDIRPIPPGMTLLCAYDDPDSEFSTVSVSHVYDPFNVDTPCIRFIAWLQPTPCTTPMYISKNGNVLNISFSDKIPRGFVKNVISPVYVLLDPRFTNFQEIQCKSNFEIVNGIPRFKFSGYQGKCIPDPNGKTLGECIVLNVKNILDPAYINSPPTLLYYLGGNLGGKKRKSFEIVGIVASIIIILIFFILIFNKKLKNKK